MNLSRCFWFIEEAAWMCVSTCREKIKEIKFKISVHGRRFPAKKGEFDIDICHLSHVVEIPMSDCLLLGHLPDLVQHRVKLESECFRV